MIRLPIATYLGVELHYRHAVVIQAHVYLTARFCLVKRLAEYFPRVCSKWNLVDLPSFPSCLSSTGDDIQSKFRFFWFPKRTKEALKPFGHSGAAEFAPTSTIFG